MEVVYGPIEWDGEGKERLRNDLERVVDRVANGYRLCDGRFEWMCWR